MGTVVVLGSLITDLVAHAPRLPLPGESLIGDEFSTFLGGKGFNQAIAAARLGAQVSLVGCIGTDAFGAAFLPVLAAEGINATFVAQDAEVGTGVSCLIVGADTGQNTIVVLPQANLALTTETAENALHAALSARTSPPQKAVFLAQCETSRKPLIAALELAHAERMTTILNLAPIPREPLPTHIFKLVDILIVNETEAALLSGIPVASIESAKAAAKNLLKKGSRHVIITLGKQGAVWSTAAAKTDEPAHVKIRRYPVVQKDATAAGDAFCGALAASLADGTALEAALRVASAAGALTVTRMGAFPALPTAAEIKALLAQEK